jgi:2-polyprenyl-3-methyl-5-hydroxy-6-metoxy-1,4-benzoquinol methylase
MPLEKLTPIRGLPAYDRSPRTEVANILPDGLNRVLEIGGAAGAFAWLLRSEHGAEVWSVEIREHLRPYLEERADRALIGDCLEIMPTLEAGSFDLVTFNDVLEHLVDPRAALNEAHRLTGPNGLIAGSLPNIQYWKGVRSIARDGDFPEEDSGLFDRTHMRWFTRKKIHRVLGECGWKIETMFGINGEYSRMLSLANKATRGRFEDMRHLQFAFLAKKA